MLVKQIQQLLEARMLCGEDLLEEDISSIFASDMMSDILACPEEIECMLTGQVNQQVIRTADMMDIPIVIFVRDKNPQEDVLTMASQRGMAILVTPYGMFKTCGILYSAGFDGGVD